MSTLPGPPPSNNQHVIRPAPTSTTIPFTPSGPSTPAALTAPPTPQFHQSPAPGTSSPGPSRPNGQYAPSAPHPSSSHQLQKQQQQQQSSNPPPRVPSTYDRESAGRKRKWSSLGFNDAEQDSLERTATAYQYALAQDQLVTLFPEPPTRFSSYEDVVQRLVPYHIWQTCDEELEGYEGGDGKKRAVQQAKDDAHAADTLKRMTKINERFMRIRTTDAERPSSTIGIIQLIKESTSALREELSTIQAQVKAVTSDRHLIEWQERLRQRRIEQERRDQEARRVAAAKAAQAQAEAQARAQAEAQARAQAEAKAAASPKPTSQAPTTAKSKSKASAAAKSTGSSSSFDAPSRAARSSDQAATTPARARGRPKGGGGLKAQAASQATNTSTPNTPIAADSTDTASAAPSGTPRNAVTTARGPGAMASAGPGSSSNTSDTANPASASKPTTSSQPVPSPSSTPALKNQSGTPAGSTRSTRANPGVNAGNGLPIAGGMKGPVSITVPITSVPELLRAEVLSRDSDGATRPPATIARKADDKKGVVLSIDLSKCNPKQLLALARVLKVDATANGSGGTRDAVAKVANGDGGGTI